MALLCSVSCAPTWPCVDRNRHDRVRGAAYDGGLGRRAVRPGWLGVRGEQCGARLGGLLAVALRFAFGGTSASDVASVAVVEANRRVMWTAAALAVAAALMALAWLGNEPPERRRAN